MSRVLTDYQAVLRRAQGLWTRGAAMGGVSSWEAVCLLHYLRQVDPDLCPAAMDELRGHSA